MILRNFYNIMAARNLGSQCTDTTTFGDGHINVKNIDGAIKYIRFGNASSDSSDERTAISTIKGYAEPGIGTTDCAVMLGTGTSPVSFDDYTINRIPQYNLSCSNFISHTPVYNSSTKKWTNTTTFVIANLTNSSITINEVGISLFMCTETYSYSSGTWVLVYREVLSNPIIIAANETVNYTQNFEFTMPAIT